MATTMDSTTPRSLEYVKDVRRNPETRDWDAYVIVGDEENYIGSRPRSWQAEALCDEYAGNLLRQLPPDEPLDPWEEIIIAILEEVCGGE